LNKCLVKCATYVKLGNTSRKEKPSPKMEPILDIKVNIKKKYDWELGSLA